MATARASRRVEGANPNLPSCNLAHKRPDVEPEEDTQQVKVAATTVAALEEKDEANAAANAHAAKQAQAETKDEDAEEAEDVRDRAAHSRACRAHSDGPWRPSSRVVSGGHKGGQASLATFKCS